MPKKKYTLGKKGLIDMLQESGLRFERVKSKKIAGSKYYTVHFESEDDMDKVRFHLSLKPRSHLYRRIEGPRVNEAKKFIYVVPFVIM